MSTPNGPYHKEGPVFIALLSSAITPATIFSLYIFDYEGWLVAFIIAFFHAILFGLPAFCFCKSHGWTQWWHSLIGGFLIGVLPVSLFLYFPYASDHFSLLYALKDPEHAKQVLKAFKEYIEMASAAGCLGMTGGLSAWMVWRGIKLPPCPCKKNVKKLPLLLRP